MIVADIVGTAFTVAGVVVAGGSLWILVRAASLNLSDRDSEVAERERVARGEGWSDDPGRKPFSDAELKALADAQAPQDLGEAGVVATPRERDPRRRGRSYGR